ncbi:MAG: chemotaxis protein CheW [Proteobacteria bacterium]|nr:chemotaxis protein CheW [Pseudomonadota bacterium]
MNLLVFDIKEKKMGFPIEYLERITENDKPIYPLPLLPKFVKGILNFQGRIVTAIDIADFCEIEDVDRRSYLLISKNSSNIGYLVKNVFGFTEVAKDSLEDAGKFDFSVSDVRFIKYISRSEDNTPLYILNIEEIEKFIKNSKNWGAIYEI